MGKGRATFAAQLMLDVIRLNKIQT